LAGSLCRIIDMNKNECKESFFKNPAKKVMKLITEEPDRILQFHIKSKLFADKYDTYLKALKKAQEEAEANPVLKDYNYWEILREVQGGKVYNYWCYTPEEAKAKLILKDYSKNKPLRKNMKTWFANPFNRHQRFWTIPLPFDPYNWITYYYGCNPLGLYDKPKEPSEDERKMCEYVVLGLIHDEWLKVPKCDRLCKIDICDLRSGIYDSLNLDYMTAGKNGETIRSRINSAINHVKTDLPATGSDDESDGSGGEVGEQPDDRKTKRKPVKKALKQVLEEFPELEGQPTKLTKKVNNKLKGWGYDSAEEKVVKNAQTSIRKERQKQKNKKI
jgi:hypothetical protein